MPFKKTSNKGTCFLCNKSFPKETILAHIQLDHRIQTKNFKLPQIPDLIDDLITVSEHRKLLERETQFHETLMKYLEGKGTLNPKKRVLLRIQPFQSLMSQYYWMFLSAPAIATLKDLDVMLRKTWLNCCGHLSGFSFRFAPNPYSDTEQLVTNFHLDSFEPGTSLRYIFDFGKETNVQVDILDVYEDDGSSGTEMKIIARNNMPVFLCDQCNETAMFTEKMLERMYCEQCASMKRMLYRIVNSPRSGMCNFLKM